METIELSEFDAAFVVRNVKDVNGNNLELVVPHFMEGDDTPVSENSAIYIIMGIAILMGNEKMSKQLSKLIKKAYKDIEKHIDE